jgi:hypothetical protein
VSSACHPAPLQFPGGQDKLGEPHWIGSGRMAIDGLKEVQEAVMLIEAGLSTYKRMREAAMIIRKSFPSKCVKRWNGDRQG